LAGSPDADVTPRTRPFEAPAENFRGGGEADLQVFDPTCPATWWFWWPLSPHRVHADRADRELHVRVLFVPAPETEYAVRRRIQPALSGFLDSFTTLCQLQETDPAT
jgi:hypothetical protein